MGYYVLSPHVCQGPPRRPAESFTTKNTKGTKKPLPHRFLAKPFNAKTRRSRETQRYKNTKTFLRLSHHEEHEGPRRRICRGGSCTLRAGAHEGLPYVSRSHGPPWECILDHNLFRSYFQITRRRRFEVERLRCGNQRQAPVLTAIRHGPLRAGNRHRSERRQRRARASSVGFIRLLALPGGYPMVPAIWKCPWRRSQANTERQSPRILPFFQGTGLSIR